MLAIVLSLSAPALSWAQEPDTAVDAPVAEATDTRLRREAEAGSAEAAFQLGLMSDYSSGDPNVALRWYLTAARAGHPEAQFNVAVMLDAGTGVGRNLASAATWYARAAANGHGRARYNLAQLYENGEGVPRNIALARYWFAAAAQTLPAAAERLLRLPQVEPATRVVDVPRPILGVLRADGGAALVDLVWTAPEGPEGAGFRVEIAVPLATGSAAPDPDRTLLADTETPASAISLRIGDPAGSPIWRVGRAATGAIAWSDWEALERSGDDEAPRPAPQRPRIAILFNPGDATARIFARELSTIFVAADTDVAIRETASEIPLTAVSYGRAMDADLAAAIAAFLPVLSPDSAKLIPGTGDGTAEVTVSLSGGPRRAQDTDP